MSDKKKRVSYSLDFKRTVVGEYKRNVPGRGFHALAKKHNIPSASIVRDWYKKRDELDAASKNRQLCTRVMRRFPGAGRKPEHQRLEEQLHAWVDSRNKDDMCARVEHVLERFEMFNLSVSVEKSEWGMSKVSYLGHQVSKIGLEAKLKNLESLASLAFPRTLKGPVPCDIGRLTDPRTSCWNAHELNINAGGVCKNGIRPMRRKLVQQQQQHKSSHVVTLAEVVA